jgi:ADP-sugar diphosphatase
LKVVRLGDLWKEGARDAKTLSAWALYCGLKREGRI